MFKTAFDRLDWKILVFDKCDVNEAYTFHSSAAVLRLYFPLTRMYFPLTRMSESAYRDRKLVIKVSKMSAIVKQISYINSGFPRAVIVTRVA